MFCQGLRGSNEYKVVGGDAYGDTCGSAAYCRAVYILPTECDMDVTKPFTKHARAYKYSPPQSPNN